MMGMMGAMMGFMIVGVLFFIVVLAVAIWAYCSSLWCWPWPYGFLSAF